MIELLKLISVPRFPDDDDGDGDGDDVVSFTNPLAAGSEAGNLSSHLVAHLIFLDVGRHVHLHVDYHNIVRMLCEGSETLTG